jgi:hypothetical protein
MCEAVVWFRDREGGSRWFWLYWEYTPSGPESQIRAPDGVFRQNITSKVTVWVPGRYLKLLYA